MRTMKMVEAVVVMTMMMMMMMIMTMMTTTTATTISYQQLLSALALSEATVRIVVLNPPCAPASARDH
jgi:hypothetical protein